MQDFLSVFPPKILKEFKSPIIGAASIKDWIIWIDNELSYPNTLSSEMTYVLKSFKESLEFINDNAVEL